MIDTGRENGYDEKNTDGRDRMAAYYLAHCALDGLSGHDAGRKLLHALWQTHVGGDLPPIAVTDRGKPYFSQSGWHFSISHTKKHAFCALSDCPIGLDAEEADRNIDLRLAEKILSANEKSQFDRASDKPEALLKFWILKEAAAKCTGEGLRGYPNHTDFDLADSRLKLIDGCFVAVFTGG
jgi:4'-phosphopantetheinyl transferase